MSKDFNEFYPLEAKPLKYRYGVPGASAVQDFKGKLGIRSQSVSLLIAVKWVKPEGYKGKNDAMNVKAWFPIFGENHPELTSIKPSRAEACFDLEEKLRIYEAKVQGKFYILGEMEDSKELRDLFERINLQDYPALARYRRDNVWRALLHRIEKDGPREREIARKAKEEKEASKEETAEVVIEESENYHAWQKRRADKLEEIKAIAKKRRDQV